MAKLPRCAETRSKAALCLKELYIVYVRSQEYGTLTSTFEEMQNLKYVCWSIHISLFHLRQFLSLSILSFKSVKVDDHFDTHLGY